MKKTIISVAALIFLLSIVSCSTGGDDDGRSAIINSLVAAVYNNCNTSLNYRDNDGNVYAYRADDIFGRVSIQAGGHSDEDEETDLGANIFGATPIFGLPDPSTYTINSGNGDPGTAYIFYFDGSGDQFISTDDNLGVTLSIEELTLEQDGTVTEIQVTFAQVEVQNINDPEDKRCISAFDLTVNNGS